jgi:hypothetical protein
LPDPALSKFESEFGELVAPQGKTINITIEAIIVRERIIRNTLKKALSNISSSKLRGNFTRR